MKKKIGQNRKESARIGGGRAPATELTPLQENSGFRFRGFWEIPLMIALKAELILQRAALAPLETEKFHVNALHVGKCILHNLFYEK